MRRASAGARTWLPLRTVARRLGRNSNLEERVVEKLMPRNTAARRYAGEGTGEQRGIVMPRDNDLHWERAGVKFAANQMMSDRVESEVSG